MSALLRSLVVALLILLLAIGCSSRSGLSVPPRSDRASKQGPAEVERHVPPERPAAWGVTRWVHSRTNIRAARTTDSAIVGKLNAGDVVKADFLKDDWCAIFDTNEETRAESLAAGYVHAPLLKPQPPKRTPPSASSSHSAAGLPSNLEHEVLETHILPGAKRSLDVRLSHKVSEEELRVLAHKLRARDPRSYERTFITYYLPGMEPGAGAWATTHFGPTLQVRILGLTRAEEARLQKSVPPSRGRLGCWVDDAIGCQYTLYRDGGRLILERRFRAGSGSKSEVVERPVASGKRYDPKERSATGDHYRLNRNGNLELWDSLGLITTLRKCR